MYSLFYLEPIDCNIKNGTKEINENEVDNFFAPIWDFLVWDLKIEHLSSQKNAMNLLVEVMNNMDKEKAIEIVETNDQEWARRILTKEYNTKN